MPNAHQVELYDAHQLPEWVDQLRSGQTESVSIVDDDVVVAVLHRPPTEPTTPEGWIVAGHNLDDEDVPPPFDHRVRPSNNIGASLWIHIASGAMIAALPSGNWSEYARFSFFYAAPNATAAVPMTSWTKDQECWNSERPYELFHTAAIAYFNTHAR